MKAFSRAHRTGLVTLAALLRACPDAGRRHAPGSGPRTTSPRGDRSLDSGQPVVPPSLGLQPRRPLDGGRRRAGQRAARTTWAAPAAACGSTTDAGKTWTNISDGFFEAGSIGAIEVSESNPNVIYVGTGSACPRGNVSPGVGMYKSTDAGKTWQHIGLRNAGSIGRIQIHPTNPEPRLRRGARQPVRAEQGARRLSLARRRQDLGAHRCDQRSHGRRRPLDGHEEPGRPHSRRCGRSSASRGRSIPAAPKAACIKIHRRRRDAGRSVGGRTAVEGDGRQGRRVDLARESAARLRDRRSRRQAGRRVPLGRWRHDVDAHVSRAAI